MLEIENKLISCNYSKRTGKANEYIVIHYTTDRNGVALNSVSWFNNPDAQASANYVIDANHIYKCVEDFNSAWHCGTTGTYKHPNCRNANSIGIEIASIHPDKKSKSISAEDANWYFDAKAIINTVELTVKLMKQYNIPISNVVRHYDVTGKVCPAPFVNDNKQWTDFKNKVIAEYNKDYSATPSEWALEAWSKAKIAGIMDGNRPHDGLTREEFAVVLNRLGLIK